MTSLGRYLANLRVENGTPFREICTFLDITPMLLDKIEKGHVLLTKNQAVKMASYFGIDVKEVLVKFQKDRIALELKNMRNNGDFIQANCLEASSKKLQNMYGELEKIKKSQLQVEVRKPSYPLNLFIESIMFCKGHHLDYANETVLPDGSVQLLIELDGEKRYLTSKKDNQNFSLKSAWINGFQEQPVTYQHRRSEKTLYINFQHGGLYAFTRIPQSEIINTAIDAELLFGTSILQLRDCLVNCKGPQEILSRVENYFIGKISDRTTPHLVVDYMCRHIGDPLSTLVKKAGYSQKHLVSIFKKFVGVTPKHFQRIRRFNGVLSQIHICTDKVNWPSLVFDNDYYDQAHFIKEFNHFSGVNPRKYLEGGTTCLKFMYDG